MYLEILIDSLKPTIYLLNKPEIYLGSLSTNDIIIGATGISRKHAKIIIQDKKIFIIDQGSTNGTYMANERLAPGKRIEFTTAEPVRLGEQVYLTLTEDKKDIVGDKNPDTLPMATLNKHDKTQVISLKALEAAKNKKIEKRRVEILNKKAIEAKKSKDQRDSYIKMLKVLAVVAGLLLIFKYSGMFSSDENDQKLFPKKEMAKEVIFEGLDEEVDYKIPDSSLISKDDMQIHLATLKCVDPDEKYFCERIPLLTEEFAGVLKVGQNLIFFVNDTELTKTNISKLQSRVKEKTLLEEHIVPEFVSKVNFLSFINKSISGLLDASHEAIIFYIVFMTIQNGKPEINSYFAVKGPIIPVIESKFTERESSTIKDFSVFIHGFDSFYRQY